MTTLVVLATLACVSAGLVGGVFFAFSVFIMRALADLPAAQGIAAMQRINVTVITPLFLGLFLGTVPLLAVTAAVAYAGYAPPGAAAWLTGALIVYTLGSVGVTMRFNVPRNNRLARVAVDSPEAPQVWALYVREWQRWNHVRCVACALAAAACAVAVAR